MVYTLRFFFSLKCSLFHYSNLFGSCFIHILYTGCAKIKKKIRRQRVKFSEYLFAASEDDTRWLTYCLVISGLFRSFLGREIRLRSRLTKSPFCMCVPLCKLLNRVLGFHETKFEYCATDPTLIPYF